MREYTLAPSNLGTQKLQNGRPPSLPLLNYLAKIFRMSTLTEPLYVPNPPGRGTIGLLFSCIFTLFLCAWTAIHLNVYPAGKPCWRRLYRKFKRTACAIIAPEFVIGNALDQFATARRLCKEQSRDDLFELQLSDDEIANSHTYCSARLNEKRTEREQWTLEQGYFAAMGGFGLKVHHDLNPETYDAGEYTTLTPEGVQLLMKCDLLPTLPKQSVRARSKSDYLAKGLVCVQVAWMLIQTIARKCWGLPITLLELNTMVHVGCAMAMYGIWWYKPQGIGESIIIDVGECNRC